MDILARRVALYTSELSGRLPPASLLMTVCGTRVRDHGELRDSPGRCSRTVSEEVFRGRGSLKRRPPCDSSPVTSRRFPSARISTSAPGSTFTQSLTRGSFGHREHNGPG